ncbi:hypothetical protein A2U01_0116236 [Trifolium medium]|uniref:Uncharacterized protein n=1 Tax=Trifolium medium TaxID=97028 RepID=A0A392W2T0_9FABA|nr:hypothetical protein [Trifolium medium]
MVTTIGEPGGSRVMMLTDCDYLQVYRIVIK